MIIFCSNIQRIEGVESEPKFDTFYQSVDNILRWRVQIDQTLEVRLPPRCLERDCKFLRKWESFGRHNHLQINKSGWIGNVQIIGTVAISNSRSIRCAIWNIQFFNTSGVFITFHQCSILDVLSHKRLKQYLISYWTSRNI